MPIGGNAVVRWNFSGAAQKLTDLGFPGIFSRVKENQRLFTAVGVQFFDKPKLNPLYNYKSLNIFPPLRPWTSVQRFAQDNTMNQLSEQAEKVQSGQDLLSILEELQNADWRTFNMTQIGVSYEAETKTQEIEVLGAVTGVGVSQSESGDAALEGTYPQTEFFVNQSAADAGELTIKHHATAGFVQATFQSLAGTGSLVSAAAKGFSSLLRPEQDVQLIFEQGTLTKALGNSKIFPSQFWVVVEWDRNGETFKPKIVWIGKRITEKDNPLALESSQQLSPVTLEKNPIS